MSKLTTSQVITLKRLSKSYASFEAQAIKFGLTKQQAWNFMVQCC